MKTILTPFLALVLLLAVGCVDDNYDLNDLEDDNTGLGDSNSIVSAPVGDIPLPLNEILEDFTRATEEYTLIDQNVEGEYIFEEGWLSDEIKNTLTSGDGTVTVTASCETYPVGLPEITLQIWFGDIAVFEENQVINATNTEATSKDFDTDTVATMLESTQISYQVYFAEKTFSCDFEDIENLILKLSVTKTGPIKF